MVAWIRASRKANLCAGVLFIAIALAIGGCGGNSSSATPAPISPTPAPLVPTPTPTPVHSISGSVNGGLAPVSGSQVTLYAAGQNAYKTGATVLGSATTDSSGKFKIGFTPPATPELLYVVVLGGNAGAGTNSAIGLMGVVGPSDAPQDPVTINELTTVAGEWAMAQFIDSTGQQAGAPTGNSEGIFNAARQAIHNLVNTETGKPAAFLPPALQCSSGLPPYNCDALKRLNTLANITAACVQSSGPSVMLPSCTAATSPCDVLFACSGTPASATTLQTAHAIATNPLENVGYLFYSVGSAGPYQPARISKPDGFEIALNLSALKYELSFPTSIEAAPDGNLWIANQNGRSVTEINPIGRFLGTFSPDGAHLNGPYDIAIDEHNHVWVTNSNIDSVTELDSHGDLIANRSPAGAHISQPYGIKIDGADNVWIANYGNDSVSELSKSSGYSTGLNFAPMNAFLNGPTGIAIDTRANVWISNYNGDSVSELTSSSGYNSGLNFTVGASFYGPLTLGLDSANNVWVANFQGTTVSELPAANYNNGATFAPAGANLYGPATLKLDSAGNIWIANFGASTLSEMQAGCTSVSCTGFSFDPKGGNLNLPYGVTVDASGNVWVASAGNSTLTEFIGMGAPTGVAAACLRDGHPESCNP